MLHIVSLDIVIDPVYGDAMRADTCDFWLTSIRSGYIIAMLAGPRASPGLEPGGFPFMASPRFLD